MKGIEFAEIRDAVTSAFNADEFDMFLYERLNFDRAVEIADGPFKVIVSEVLKKAERDGWDPILIAEVAAARPLRQDLRQVYAKYAQALVDEARQRNVESERLKAIDKYQLAPKVLVQTAGKPTTPSAVLGTEEGLERAVRPYLPHIDVSLWRQRLFNLEGQVCRVEVNNQALGTGFLVGADALLTNYHVLRSVIDNPNLAATVRLRFDYRVLPNGAESDGTLVSLAPGPGWLIDYTPYTGAEKNNTPDASLPTVDELDFALVKLDRAIGKEPLIPNIDSTQRGWIPVPTATPHITSNPPMPVLILQHPNTQPLKLAVDTAGVLSLNENGTRVRYATNTEPGSSGSPCFNLNWTLIALHHYGDPLHNEAEWNQGVPISMIRNRLARQGKDGVLGNATA